jgi:hypothetical protein
MLTKDEEKSRLRILEGKFVIEKQPGHPSIDHSLPPGFICSIHIRRDWRDTQLRPRKITAEQIGITKDFHLTPKLYPLIPPLIAERVSSVSML